MLLEEEQQGDAFGLRMGSWKRNTWRKRLMPIESFGIDQAQELGKICEWSSGVGMVGQAELIPFSVFRLLYDK